jgi:hypothetical protein
MTDDDLLRRLRERLVLPDVLPGDVPRGDFDLNPHLGNTPERHATLKAWSRSGQWAAWRVARSVRLI